MGWKISFVSPVSGKRVKTTKEYRKKRDAKKYMDFLRGMDRSPALVQGRGRTK